MLNSLRDGQINYGTTNCPSAHVPPHNVVAPIHQNSLHSTEPTTPVVYPWNSNPRLEQLYGFHSRYYNLDFPSRYPPATNQYVPASIYGQNVSQCCQPCCRIRSQNIPKTSPPQVLYNPIRPVQQLNRSNKSKKTLKTPCSEQFLPYIANDLPVKYDTQNCYQQKYGSSYLNNTNYCPPANNLWIPPAANPTWAADRLRPVGHQTGVTSHDFNREKNYQRLQNYQSYPYPNPTSSTHHRPYSYIPPIPDVQNYRTSVYHNSLKNNTSEYVSQEHSSRLPIPSLNNQSPASLQQYYNVQPVPYSDEQKPSELFKPPQVTPQNSSKSNLNVREFLATWDEGEEEISEKSSETTAPIVVLDCMTLEGDALTKIQEKLNVVSYENLEKVLKENNNPLVINTESSELDSIHNKIKPPSKPNFEPIDYTKRETGIIKPFNTEKKRSPTVNTQSDKNYSVNFDGMVAWYGKKNADISSTDLIEKLADRIFNLSKSQENDGVSFGTAAYTGQITQTNRSITSSVKDSSKYVPSQHMYGLQHHTERCVEPSVINKIDCNNDSISRIHSCVLNDSKKAPTIKSNNINSSCIVENINKKCLNVTNEETAPWNLDQGSQEQHLNTSLYDHSVIIKPLDFSSLTDETKGNPFVFEKNTTSGNKSNTILHDQFNKVLNENNNYNTTVSNNQQIDSSNRNFPVIVSPHRQEYNGFHESVIQRTGCDKNKHDKVPTQTDFENMNWNISNDLDKIIKNTNIGMEPSCLYDRNNYNILDSIHSDKNVSNQWKDNVPCVDLTVNSKTNNNHDSFFDSWNFIESYENHSSKKLINPPSNNNEIHNPLFSHQMTSLVESNNKHNSGDKIDNETMIPIKNIPNDVSTNNVRSQDVFNLDNRIPDFSDGFELPVIHEPHDYMQFKKASNENERRTDGSIFEHLNETKCIRTVNEMINAKTDQNKSDIGLPSFKEKEPLAPMLVPPKLNIVKPILRDPSQIYSVIKQKLKYDNTCVDNDGVVSNKSGNNLRGNHINNFNLTDLKSKYNNVQLNQFDVWSEKFELKSNSNNSSSAVVHCDVEITQFKSTPENRNALIPKANISEDYQEKNEKLPENTNCNSTMNKINVIENEKINSNDFLNCLESTKTDDQKYRDTLDEFETSFGFDIHCNNESNKSFHEDIVDKCLEERIKDQIGEHNMHTPDSIVASNHNINNTQLPFQCDFQSGYLIKNYFDENKNKTIVFDRKQTSHDEKSNKTSFIYHSEVEHSFDLQNNKILNVTQNSEKNCDYNILNSVNCSTEQIQNDNKITSSNFLNQSEFKPSFELKHQNTDTNKLPSTEKNNLDYLTIEDRHFKFENNKKNILELTHSKEIFGINKPTDNNDVCTIRHSNSNTHKLSNIRKHSSVNFELNISNTNIFETNSNTSNMESKTETNKNLEMQNMKNSFDSTFHSENSINIKPHNFNPKNIFGIENNNCVMYQTQNLGKMNDFDFETRIIQNFDMECSNSNVQEPTSSKQVFSCENQIKTKYGLEIYDENNAQKVTQFKNTPNIPEILRIEKTSDVDCNDVTQLNNVIETENAKQENKIDHMFEVSCGVNNIREKENIKICKDFDIQNKNADEINLINCSTNEKSIMNNNTEVENIFENLYGNLTTLNKKKVDSNISDQCVQNYDTFDASKSQHNVNDQNLKINEPVIVNEDSDKTKLDECRHDEADQTFEQSNTVLLQELVNKSASHLTATLLQKKTQLEEELTVRERDIGQFYKHVQNKNENVLDISNINAVHENTKMFEEHQNKEFKQNEIDSINQNNIHTLKNIAVNTVQDDTIKKMFENIKSSSLDAIKNTDDENSLNISHGSHYLDELSCQKYSQIVEDQDSTKPDFNSSNHVEPTCQLKSNIIEIENPTNSVSSSLSHVELPCQKNSINVEIESSASPGSSLLDHVESTYQHSNEFVDVEDSTSSESSSLNSTEFTCQQNLNNNVEIEDSTSSESNFTNPSELIFQQNSNNMVEVKDSDISEPNLTNHSELIYQQNSNNIVEVEDLTRSEFNSSNVAELVCIPNFNNDVEVQDSTISESSSSNHAEPTYQQNSNNDVEIESSASFESSSLNHDEPTCQQNSYNNVEVQDSACSESSSSNHAELTCQSNSNNIVEVEHLTCSDYNSSIQAKHTCRSNSNNMIEVEDLTCSESNSSNHAEHLCEQNSNNNEEDEVLSCSEHNSPIQAELTCQLNSNNNVEVGDLTCSKSSSSNHAEPPCEQNTNDYEEVQDLACSEYNSSIQAELTCQLNSNNNVEVGDLTCSKSSSSNHAEPPCEQNTNYYEEVQDLACSEYNSSIQAELACRPNSSNKVKVEDFTCSELCSSNHAELHCQRNANTNVEVRYSTNSGSNSLNHAELACQQNSNNCDEIDSLASSESSSSFHAELTSQQISNNNAEFQDSASHSSSTNAELTYQPHLNSFVGIENSINPRSTSPLNHIELTIQKHSSNIVKVKDLTDSKPSPLYNIKSTYQQHHYKSIEVKVPTSSKSNLLNHDDLTYQQSSNDIVDVEGSIDTGLSLLNNVELTCQQNVDDIVEVENLSSTKSSALFEYNSLKLNRDPSLKHSKIIDNSIQLPRVKFILKCHRKNMVKKNIFDEESVVPLKKCNLVKDENFIARHICKMKNNFYRPWHSVYRKDSVVEPKEIIKEVEINCSQTINKDNIPQSIESLDLNDKEKENKVLSSSNLPSSNEKHSIEKSNDVENDEKYINECESTDDNLFTLDELNTPMPSPFDDFQSENHSPEHYGGEEYWDKSLENEYNNVLHQAISKLTKIRVNIRDKFDIRLLARRVNGTKQRKWRRQWRRRRRLDIARSINVDEFVVGDIVSVKVPTEVLRINSTKTKTSVNHTCKIKVQLPWGRIFNFNSTGVEDSQKTKDTKIELGPAKVEVRLSQTPGEWQVAACESMTSPKSVVSVRRLVVQRARSAKEDYDYGCDSPAKDSDGDCNSSPKNYDGGCNSPAKEYGDCSSSPANDHNDVCTNSTKSYNGDCNSPEKENEAVCYSPAKDYDEDCNISTKDYGEAYNNLEMSYNSDYNSPVKDYDGSSNIPRKDNDDSCTISSSSSSSISKDNSRSGSNINSGIDDDGELKEHSRKLPKIVIRRIGQDNNYTSYVSSSGGFEGGDKNDGARQLMVRLIRDRHLDAMAAEGITTVHLKHNVPISESVADTHGAKRVRYT